MPVVVSNRHHIGIRELRNHLSEVLQAVRDRDLTFDVTLHGTVVAELSPHSNNRDESKFVTLPFLTKQERERRQKEREPELQRQQEEQRRLATERRDTLLRELARPWPSGLSAMDAVREDRQLR